MVSKVNGIVIKETDVGETGKRIMIITREHGKMLLSVRGAKNAKSKTMAGTQLFSYSEFSLFEGKGFYSATQADAIESFYGIRSDIDRLAYGAYILELTERTAFEDLEDIGMFELLLRTLLVLSKDSMDSINPQMITAVFIIRLLKESGFIGELYGCQKCGNEFLNEAYLANDSFELICCDCAKGNETYIGSGTLKAVNYIIGCRMPAVYKFNVSDEVLKQLWIFADSLRREYLGDGYKTLDYIRNMKFSY